MVFWQYIDYSVGPLNEDEIAGVSEQLAKAKITEFVAVLQPIRVYVNKIAYSV